MGFDDIGAVDYTVLLCRNMSETRAFYRNVMHFQIEIDRETWVSFRVGKTLLALRPRGQWPLCEDGPLPGGSAAVQLAFKVSLAAIDGCHAELLAKGVPILRGPTDLPQWRHRTLFFRDPEDNILELFAEF